MENEIIVRHHEAERRYEAVVEGRAAECVYEPGGDPGVRVFTHTFVPGELRGRGVAEALVRVALDDARRQRLRIVAACGYVAAFIRRHPGYRDLVA